MVIHLFFLESLINGRGSRQQFVRITLIRNPLFVLLVVLAVMAIEETEFAPTDSAALSGAGAERHMPIVESSWVIGQYAHPVLNATVHVVQANTQVEHLSVLH